MTKLVDEYLLFLYSTKQVSDNTYKSYKRDLKKLTDYFSNKNIDDLTRIREADLQEYIDYLKKMDYASTTIIRSYISIKSVFSFLCQKGYIEHNPALHIELPKPEGTPNIVLKKAEMEKLLNPPVVFSFKGLRDRAMLLLLYYTKISISELVKLKVEAVHFEKNTLICINGNKTREYSMNPETSEALETYINYKKLNQDDWLFPNRYGNPMSRQGFWKTIKNYAVKIGIEKEITLYSIKHGEL